MGPEADLDRAGVPPILSPCTSIFVMLTGSVHGKPILWGSGTLGIIAPENSPAPSWLPPPTQHYHHPQPSSASAPILTDIRSKPLGIALAPQKERLRPGSQEDRPHRTVEKWKFWYSCQGQTTKPRAIGHFWEQKQLLCARLDLRCVQPQSIGTQGHVEMRLRPAVQRRG